MADLDPYLAGDASDEEQQAALAQALRRQQALGFLGQLSGDKVLGNVGQSLLDVAGQGLGRMETAKTRRQQLALEAKKDAQAQAHQQAMEGFEKQRLGLEGSRLNQEAWQPVQSAEGLFEINKKTGQVRPVLGPGGSPLTAPKSQQASVREDALVGRLSENMLHDLDPAKWGGAGEIQVKTRDTAKHLLGLAQKAGEPGGIRNLDSREMEELAVGLAKMIKGGTPGEAEARAYVPPKNLEAGWAGIKEWLLDKPEGLEQQKFVEKMAHSVERQRDIADEIINQTKAQRVAAHRKLRQKDPEQWEANVIAAGLDPTRFDEKGVYQTPAKTEPADDKKAKAVARIQELKAQGMDAAAIKAQLKKEGF